MIHTTPKINKSKKRKKYCLPVDPRVRANEAAQVFGAVEKVDGGSHTGSEEETQGGHLEPARHREPHHHITGPVHREDRGMCVFSQEFR